MMSDGISPSPAQCACPSRGVTKHPAFSLSLSLSRQLRLTSRKIALALTSIPLQVIDYLGRAIYQRVCVVRAGAFVDFGGGRLDSSTVVDVLFHQFIVLNIWELNSFSNQRSPARTDHPWAGVVESSILQDCESCVIVAHKQASLGFTFAKVDQIVTVGRTDERLLRVSGYNRVMSFIKTMCFALEAH